MPEQETHETGNQEDETEEGIEEEGTEQNSGNEEDSSVPEQETHETGNQEDETEEVIEEEEAAEQEQSDDTDAESGTDEELLVPEEDYDGNSSEGTGQNGNADTGGNGDSEVNPDAGDQPENDNDGNEQIEPEDQEDNVGNYIPPETADPENQEPEMDGSDERQNYDFPHGSESTEESDAGEISDEAPEAADEHQTENVIEGGQEDSESREASSESGERQKSGVAGKKLYRYGYGDILNGIDLKPGTSEEHYSTLDKRVNRIMTSKIVEEDDMTEEQIMELEEEIKNESGVVSSDRDALPDTGETNQYNLLYSFMLISSGIILFFLTKRPGKE